MTRILILPWMPSALRPHAVVNPWPRINATKAYRKLCGQEAIAQGFRKMDADEINATVTFRPPHRRGDRQNDEAAMKAGIDGIADVIGVDDKHWNITWKHGEVVRGGASRSRLRLSAQERLNERDLPKWLRRAA